MRIGKYKAIESSYYKVVDGKVYRNVLAGLIENPMRTTRKVGDFKIHVEHFDCALPYSNYYIIDGKSEKIYEIRDIHFTILEDLVEHLKNGNYEV